MVLSIEERIFLVEYVFRERVISKNLWHPRSPDFTPPDFCLRRAAKPAMYRDRPRTLNELKIAITAYIRNISQADLHKVSANKIKRVQTLYRRSWRSLPTPFISAQQFKEGNVLVLMSYSMLVLSIH
jgi:hypothetical protein